MTRIFVAKTAALEIEGVKVVRVGKTDAAVFSHAGTFHAFKDACPHQGHPLSRGRVTGGRLSCPGHNWQFELHSGRCVKGDTEIVLKRFEVVIEGDSVFIDDREEMIQRSPPAAGSR